MRGCAAVSTAPTAVLGLHSPTFCFLLVSPFHSCPPPPPRLLHLTVIEAFRLLRFPFLPLPRPFPRVKGGRGRGGHRLSPWLLPLPLSPSLLISCIHILAIHSCIQSFRPVGPPAGSPEGRPEGESAGRPAGNLTSWKPSMRASGSTTSAI